MTIKDKIENLKQRISYAKMVFNNRDDLQSCDQELYALKHDNGSLLPENRNHYKFDSMPQSDFTDFVAKKIGLALTKSKKATAITLFHGDVTDKGMSDFLKGVAETKAPIKALHIDDMPYVTDKSLQVLPAIIEKKGITICNITCCNISSELKKQINAACNKNQGNLLIKEKENLK